MRIALEKASKTYHLSDGAPVTALRETSIVFQPGSVTAIVGPSGAGKSTLLHIVGLMDRPTTGAIKIDDVDCAAAADTRRAALRREKIGFLFQMHYLLPDFTVLENVLMPLWEQRQRHRARVEGLLDQLGLSSRLTHLPHELSGGEQQRAALARALVNEPSLLLADEPTGNLDSVTGAVVQDIMFAACAKRNMTVILVTHSEQLAQKTNRIVTMRDGIITEDTER